MESSRDLVVIDQLPGEAPRLAYESHITPLADREVKKTTSEWPTNSPDCIEIYMGQEIIFWEDALFGPMGRGSIQRKRPMRYGGRIRRRWLGS